MSHLCPQMQTPSQSAHSPAPKKQRTPDSTPKSDNQSYGYGCSVPMALILLATGVLLAGIIHSGFNHQMDPKGCTMTFMQPSYYRLLGLRPEQTKLALKYSLLLYRDEYDYVPQVEHGKIIQTKENEWSIDEDAKLRPTGVPALFIPGNAGSAKQVRSMAKEASKYYYQTLGGKNHARKPSSRPLDFYSVDFNEEFTAFHGKSLWDQARYVNEAIAYIRSLYSDDRSTTRPTSILLIGHSMGGIVARTIFTLDNFQHGSVDTIVTVATPHAVPPVALDYEATHIYDIITSFWTRGHTGEGAALKNVTLISIMGGTLDTTVSGDAANIHSIVPQSHGFTVFTSNIPHAWVGCDHLSILWCNQVASAIGQTLVQVADAHYSEGGASVAERMAIFRRRLLTGAEKNGPEDIQMIDLDDIPHTFVGTKGSWAFPPTDDSSRSESIVPHLFLLQLSNLRLQGHDTVTMLTDHGLGQHSRLDLLLCKKAVEENLNRKSLLCSGSNLPVFPVPASTEASSIPLFTGEYFTAREFQSMSLSLDEVADYQYLAVLDRGRRFSDAGFLVAQPVNISATIKTVESSLLGHLTTGISIDLSSQQPTLTSAVRLPNIDNSLIAYILSVDKKHCRGQAKSRFSTIMKQSSWNMHEDRYFVNIDAKSSININFHGDSPYYTKMSQPGKRGIELLFWTDPSCSELLSLNLRIDVYGSLGRVLIRYRMVVLVFTYMVVIITIQSQFRNWIQGDAFKSFGATLCQLTVTRFWKVSAVLAVIAFVQSLQAKAFVELGSSDQQEDDSWLFKTGIIWRDMLLGGNATFFWFLAPVFYQMAVGITVLIWFVLNTLVGLLAGALALAMRSNMAQDSGVPMPQKHIKSIAISTIVQFALVAAIVPHHFAFVMTILRIVFLCAKELNIAKELSTSSSGTQSQRAASWNRFHYMSSILVLLFTLVPFAVPGLMAFARNILVQWHEPFSADHYVYHVAPFVIFTETLAYGATIPRQFSSGTDKILSGIVVFLILFGVQYTWQIYTMTWLWVAWLLLLQLWDTRRLEQERPKHE